MFKDKSYSWFGFVLVFLLTFFVWYRLLGQAFLGEGAYYFSEPWATQFLRSNSFWVIISRYDLQTILFFGYLADVIRDNMKVYYSISLLGITFVNFGVFAVVRKVTKSFWAGIIAATLLISHFFGSFQMLGQGVYVYFSQRVPNFALALFSLVFLMKFFEFKKIKNYWIAFVLYSAAIILARYTFLISLLILFYIFLSFVFENIKDYKKWVSGIIYTLPFAALTFVAIRYQDPGFRPMEETFFQFILNRSELFSGVLTRLTLITVPAAAINFLSNAFKGIYVNIFKDTSMYSFTNTVLGLSYWVFAAYLIVTSYIAIKYKKLRVFIISTFLTILASIVMVLYLRISILDESLTSRYLYSPSMLASMFWGVFLFTLFKSRKLFRLIIPGLIILYMLHQRSIIIKHFDIFQPRCDEVLSSISFIKSNYKNFPDNSLVILTKNQGWAHVHMYNRFYGERNIEYLAETIKVNEIDDRIKKRGFEKQEVFSLTYNSGETFMQRFELNK